jgi:hypothetical protein
MSLAISVGVLACGPDADPEAVEYHRKNFRDSVVHTCAVVYG